MNHFWRKLEFDHHIHQETWKRILLEDNFKMYCLYFVIHCASAFLAPSWLFSYLSTTCTHFVLQTPIVAVSLSTVDKVVAFTYCFNICMVFCPSVFKYVLNISSLILKTTLHGRSELFLEEELGTEFVPITSCCLQWHLNSASTGGTHLTMQDVCTEVRFTTSVVCLL